MKRHVEYDDCGQCRQDCLDRKKPGKQKQVEDDKTQLCYTACQAGGKSDKTMRQHEESQRLAHH